jgi:hypothetical protein
VEAKEEKSPTPGLSDRSITDAPRPRCRTRSLRDLSPEDVEGLLDKVAAGRSHRTIVRVKSYLGQALAVAQSRRKVSWNVARVAEMPETAEPEERRSLTLTRRGTYSTPPKAIAWKRSS